MRVGEVIIVLGLVFSGCARTGLLVAGDPDSAQARADGGSLPRGDVVGHGAAGTAQGQDRTEAGSSAGADPPLAEACNGADDDLDGRVDEDTGLGEACDGPDNDLCPDDSMTCGGCSSGDDNIEVCNGVDDDCDGTVDADCERGECTPALRVVEVAPSRSTCFVDAVQKGSRGELAYPCGGGPVTATFGSIVATGQVSGDSIDLEATTTFDFDDGCTWQSAQRITGRVSSGRLTYTYEESPVAGTDCADPCTAQGTLEVIWDDAPNGVR